VIARLKIADICFATRGGEVFRRTRDRDRGELLVVVLNDDSLLPDVSQYPGERGCVRIAALGGTALRIRLTRISATPGVSTAGVANPAAGNDDLAETRNAGQQENDGYG